MYNICLIFDAGCTALEVAIEGAIAYGGVACMRRPAAVTLATGNILLRREGQSRRVNGLRDCVFQKKSSTESIILLQLSGKRKTDLLQ